MKIAQTRSKCDAASGGASTGSPQKRHQNYTSTFYWCTLRRPAPPSSAQWGSCRSVKNSSLHRRGKSHMHCTKLPIWLELCLDQPCTGTKIELMVWKNFRKWWKFLVFSIAWQKSTSIYPHSEAREEQLLTVLDLAFSLTHYFRQHSQILMKKQWRNSAAASHLPLLV